MSAPTVILPDQRTVLPGPPNAPFVREQCFDDGHTWVGVVSTEPGACSPWHHHGEYETYVYLLEGQARIEYVDDGVTKTLDLDSSGAFIIVPKGLPHREINPGTTKNRFVITRVGHGPSVVPVDAP